MIRSAGTQRSNRRASGRTSRSRACRVSSGSRGQEETLQKTAQAFERAATGKPLESPDWRYGLSIDDMIARVHDVDPGLPWNKGVLTGQLQDGSREFIFIVPLGHDVTLRPSPLPQQPARTPLR